MFNLKNSNREIDSETYKKALNSVNKLITEKEYGFLNVLDKSDQWSQALSRSTYIKSKASKLIVIGMGGSALCGISLTQSLNFTDNRIEFWDSIDPDFLVHRINAQEDIKNVHWLVISKSGSTLETLSMVNFVFSHLKDKDLSPNDNVTIITENTNNPLRNFAEQNSFSILDHPKDIGGRFSSFTNVGLLPCLFIGADSDNIKKGIGWTLESPELIAQLVTHSLQSWDRNEWLSMFWPYDYKLKGFCRLIQQLWAESLGKKSNIHNQAAPRASTPMYCLGSREQHSVLQQVSDGYKDKMVWFFTKKQSNKSETGLNNHFTDLKYLDDKSLNYINFIEANCCIDALAKKDVSFLSLEYESLNESVISALIMSFQLVIASLGDLLEINAFDQPGVELGKKLTINALNNK